MSLQMVTLVEVTSGTGYSVHRGVCLSTCWDPPQDQAPSLIHQPQRSMKQLAFTQCKQTLSDVTGHHSDLDFNALIDFPLFDQIFSKTAWKWRNLGRGGWGARPKFYYVDPPLGTTRLWRWRCDHAGFVAEWDTDVRVPPLHWRHVTPTDVTSRGLIHTVWSVWSLGGVLWIHP